MVTLAFTSIIPFSTITNIIDNNAIINYNNKI